MSLNCLSTQSGEAHTPIPTGMSQPTSDYSIPMVPTPTPVFGKPTPTHTPTPTPVPPKPIRPSNLAEGLIAHYAFEGDVNSHDRLHDATNSYSESYIEQFVEGVTGRAITFSHTEVTPYLQVSGKPGFNFNKTFTFSAWVYNSFILSYNPLIDRPEQELPKTATAILSSQDITMLPYAFYWTPGGAEMVLNVNTPDELWLRRRDYPRPEVQAVEGWQHWVATYDGQAVRIYFNGQLDLETPYTQPIMQTPNSSNIFIGRCDGLRRGTDEFHFNGYSSSLSTSLDELRIYDRALSAKEVKQLYDFK